MADSVPNSKSIQDILDREPQFVNDTPLDTFFQSLNEKFISKIRCTDGLNLYQLAECDGNKGFVSKCIGYLTELHFLVREREASPQKDNLLPISLHDMKYFDELVNLIIVHGVYANLPEDLGIPLEQRQLTNFKQEKKIFSVHKRGAPDLKTLELVLSSFYEIFANNTGQKDTVREMLLKGTGYIDCVTGYVALLCETPGRAAEYEEKLEKLESMQETYELFSMYSLLVHSTKKFKYKGWVLNKLSTLPIRRDDGVTSLVDFVVGIREDEEISADKLERVNQILLAKPKTVTNVEYFSKLFARIYDGLTYVNRPILVSCLNHLVTGFYYKNRRIVQDFLFPKIEGVLFNPEAKAYSEKQLNDCINVLISLAKNSSTEVINELVSNKDANNFYLHLWIYALYLNKYQKLQPNGTQEKSGPYYNVVLKLIKTFMKVNADYQVLDYIVLNLVNFDHKTWGYAINLETQLPYIIPKDSSLNSIPKELKVEAKDDPTTKFQHLFLDIDLAVQMMIEFLNLVNDEDVTKTIFLSVINRWVTSTNRDASSLMLHTEEDNFSESLLSLVNLKLLEKLNETFKSGIIKKPRDILYLIDNVLGFSWIVVDGSESEQDSDDDEDEAEHEPTNPLAILLELLSNIITSSTPDRLLNESPILSSISSKLNKHPKDEKCVSLKHRIDKYLSTDVSTSSPSCSVVDGETDQESLEKALANIHDSLVPIRAHGLFQLRQLIESGSPAVNIQTVLDLHIQQLRDPEPFVYLNAIKGLSALCQTAPNDTLPLLLDIYQPKTPPTPPSLDESLRLGEVFINYITTENELFQGAYANSIVNLALHNIRERDSTDNRIRMSSISILGVCLKTNPAGISSHIPDILDCAFAILQLEHSAPTTPIKDNSAIMRRAAVHLIHDYLSNSPPTPSDQHYSPTKLYNLLLHHRPKEPDYLVCELIDDLLHLLRDFQTSLYTSSTTSAITRLQTLHI
ncbi:Rtp1p Ecym_2149 [Eremothecium cymbalariae DBVPG|uniref:RNA polymerase II assembly factor Rtp1 C-terminal domain-containing protein n=1 Tax=Eremothecium cymbalariae (strain CBS 270.75 / DBVPG 7215 / KCTC 17166 / NRRL Y-17582) TaxID=931890 RepID=G8JNI5_ERECY|nr:Hypothetical protein Ecym_2149 [Eremothecium cymbalariae DBVPG\